MKSKRHNAAARGRHAEQVVAAYLLRHGYKVLGQNVRVGHLEIDILAQKGSVVAVVEVRYRGPSAWQGPFESIDEAKCNRLIHAASQLWNERFEQDRSVDRVRFDVAAVHFPPNQPPNIEYIEGAFD